MRIVRDSYQISSDNIKMFLKFHEKDDKIKDKRDVTIPILDCDNCDKKEKCDLFKTGKGNCQIFDSVYKAELPRENYISIKDIENKEARYFGRQKMMR